MSAIDQMRAQVGAEVRAQTTAQLTPTKSLRIGELAARTGHTVHAIRWYESQGLIPGVMRDAGGRRSYRERHLGWVELIDKLRLTGMSIAQIRDYAVLVTQGRGTIKQQQELLRDHRTRVRGTIGEWEAALQMLDHKIEYFDEWLTTGKRPDKAPEKVALKQVKERSNGRLRPKMVSVRR
jgi:DNA-binding transcriptional MerR regulator